MEAVKPPVKQENGNATTNNADSTAAPEVGGNNNRGPKKFGNQNQQNRGPNKGPNKFGGNNMNRGGDRDRNNKGPMQQNRNNGPKNEVKISEFHFFQNGVFPIKHAFVPLNSMIAPIK